MFTEVYLEPSRTSMMGLFLQKSTMGLFFFSKIAAVAYFYKSTAS